VAAVGHCQSQQLLDSSSGSRLTAMCGSNPYCKVMIMVPSICRAGVLRGTSFLGSFPEFIILSISLMPRYCEKLCMDNCQQFKQLL